MAVAAESYVVVDADTGHVLDSADADVRRPVASLTKIAMALVVLDWLGESGVEATDLMDVPGDALRGGANPLGLREGDRLPIEVGLYAAIMASDNTSASVLAQRVGRAMDPAAEDGVAVFVERMNALAQRLGMSETRFVNPHGLDAGEGTGWSTAGDMARLAIHAHGREDFASLCGERERTVAFLRGAQWVEVKLANTNELVGSRGIDGTKTGTTQRAGQCLIATATRSVSAGEWSGERRLVSVLLGAEGDRFGETVLLLDRGWKRCAEWLADGGDAVANQGLRKQGD